MDMHNFVLLQATSITDRHSVMLITTNISQGLSVNQMLMAIGKNIVTYLYDSRDLTKVYIVDYESLASFLGSPKEMGEPGTFYRHGT